MWNEICLNTVIINFMISATKLIYFKLQIKNLYGTYSLFIGIVVVYLQNYIFYVNDKNELIKLF